MAIDNTSSSSNIGIVDSGGSSSSGSSSTTISLIVTINGDSEIYEGQSATYNISVNPQPSGLDNYIIKWYVNDTLKTIQLYGVNTFSFSSSTSISKSYIIEAQLFKSLISTSPEGSGLKTITVKPTSETHFLQKGVDLFDATKDIALVCEEWPHTIDKDILENSYYRSAGLESIKNYAIYTNSGDESPVWDKNSVNTDYYFKKDEKDIPLHIINKKDVTSYLHNINEELKIKDYVNGSSSNSFSISRDRYIVYYSITRSNTALTVHMCDLDTDNVLESYTLSAKDFIYGEVPNIFYVASCGGGAAGIRGNESGSTGFLHVYYGKSGNTKGIYFAAGGGSGASYLFGLDFSGNCSTFFVKVGPGGRQYIDGRTYKIRSEHTGDSTIISTDLRAIGSKGTDRSTKYGEVLIIEGGKQFDTTISKSFGSSQELFDSLTDATVKFYKNGKSIDIGNSDYFLSVPASINQRKLVNGKKPTLLSSGISTRGDTWDNGAGFVENPDPYTGNKYHSVWFDINGAPINWSYVMGNDVPGDYWRLLGVDISGKYQRTPNFLKTVYYAGPYFKNQNDGYAIGGSSSLFGNGSGQTEVETWYWEGFISGPSMVSWTDMYGKGVSIATMGDLYNGSNQGWTLPDYPRSHPEYGAGGYAVDSNSWMDRMDTSVVDGGGTGCFFLYY